MASVRSLTVSSAWEQIQVSLGANPGECDPPWLWLWFRNMCSPSRGWSVFMLYAGESFMNEVSDSSKLMGSDRTVLHQRHPHWNHWVQLVQHCSNADVNQNLSFRPRKYQVFPLPWSSPRLMQTKGHCEFRTSQYSKNYHKFSVLNNICIHLKTRLSEYSIIFPNIFIFLFIFSKISE